MPLLTTLALIALQDSLLSPVEQGVMACMDVSDGAARLACYDRTAQPLRQMRQDMLLPPQPAPAPSASATPYPAPRAAPSAGSPYAASPSPTPPQRSEGPDGALPQDMPVARIDFSARDKAYITLANGEVWRQLNSDSTDLSRKVDDIKTATIREGALGSRRMRLEPLGRTIRVRQDD
ncbi:hypothetical protein [Parvularcula dongshanensis]|uniref:Uncharacterized protein n=1 Tax=Parvularcula dongshanensis TaxID=1173995 RepID=A0A840I0W8_9PROT|nr:hypothetical protein [Parvularcula dongshanensis]MBB4657985.1 hypothetical protein [Parvularcula dongshanensis]